MSRTSVPLTAVALMLAACQGADRSEQRHTLVDSRDWEDPRSLDPARSTDVPTGRAVAYLFDGLTRFAPDASVEAGLAERWEASEDGLRYTFHLRPNVQFHDGRSLKASHVIESFRRVLDPGSTGGRGWPLYPIKDARAYSEGSVTSITGLSAPDDSTVVITLEEPLAIFPKLLAMPVASVVPDNLGENFGEQPIGTGPWKLVEWRHDDYVKFARNENYFGGAPSVDTLIARIIPEPSTAVAEFENGAVDILYVPEDQTASWESTPERRAMLHSAPALRLWYVGVNVTRGPLADVRVRRAIAHAIDTKTILDKLLGGRGTLAAGVIPPSLDGANADRAPYAFDVARARKLLAEAGHPNGINLELWSSQTAPLPRIAEAMQAYLADAGIRVQLVQRDAASVREAARNGQVDLILKDWYADYPDAENFLYPLLHSANHGVGGNVSFYRDAVFDSLVTLARREGRDAERIALYRQADSLAHADVGLLPLFFYNELYAVQPWVQGFEVPVIFNGQRWSKVSLGNP